MSTSGSWFTHSIRRTLVLGLLIILGVISSVSGAFSYRDALIEANELFDAKLAHSARLLKSLLGAQLGSAAGASTTQVVELWSSSLTGEGDALATADGHAYETHLAFQVWDRQGKLLLRSTSAPETPLAPLEPGFANVNRGAGWRCFTLASDGLWFQAGEEDVIRSELASDIAFGSMLPALLALPIAGALVWIFVGYGCRTLERVAREVQERSPTRLEPVSTAAVPREIQGLVHSVNDLMGQVDAALERERRFTADAAHELRTPLAGLQIHADNLIAANNAEQRQNSAAGLRTGVERTQRLLGQLLELARLEPQTALQQLQPLGLANFLKEQLASFAEGQSAVAERMVLDLAPGAHLVLADPFALGILLRNLIDNSLRYGPEDGEIRIGLEGDANSVRLSVEDDGPGIPADARGRVLQRFHRELGTEATGSGLGLSIVQRIVELHSARLELGPGHQGRGLRVVVEFRRC